jgi:signal transduction histidine kinase
MKTLIDDILKYSQTLNFSQSINDFTFEQLLHELNAMIHMPDNFELNQKGPNVLIAAPKAALLQILSNLINNAIRYNDKATGKVSIVFDEEGDHYSFSVTDNGQGIREEDFDKIFEQNYTSLGDKKDRFNTLGQGIGLSTVKRLINKLGGDIIVSSKLGEGTTFKFTIAKQL